VPISCLPKAAVRVYSHLNMPTVILIIIAILLPPLAVYLKTNSGKQTVINLILCLFFWIPGVLHALYLILAKK
jgi:uncharacterized membrane protein YqaE (UPF0057 family)